MGRDMRELRIRNNKIRRRRELRRHVFTGLVTTVLVIGCSLLFFSLKISAQSRADVQSKYYKSIQVQEGDSLWNYAGLYGDSRYYDSRSDYIKEVSAVNALKNDRITAGQYLILPYYDAGYDTCYDAGLK